MVQDEQEALLVPAKDASALADALVRVLTDAALASRLAEAARTASGRYSLERHVNTLEALYRETVSNG